MTTINGSDLLKSIKPLIHQGNLKKITLETKSGRQLFSINLTIAIVLAVLFTPFVAIGLIVALVAECNLRLSF
jgi:hypothetical protein